jgi:hypothetical protein
MPEFRLISSVRARGIDISVPSRSPDLASENRVIADELNGRPRKFRGSKDV